MTGAPACCPVSAVSASPREQVGHRPGVAGGDACRRVERAANAQQLREAVRLAERDHLRRPLALSGYVASQPVHDGLDEEGEGEAERVTEVVRQHYRLTGAGERAIRPAEGPATPRTVVQCADARIVSERGYERVVSSRLVQASPRLAVGERRREFPLVELG